MKFNIYRFIFSILLIIIVFNSVKAEEKSFTNLASTINKVSGPMQFLKNSTNNLLGLGYKKLLFATTAVGLIATGSDLNKKKIKNSKPDSNYKKKNTDNAITKVITIGRIYIDDLSEEVAKRKALEDALYLAALKGGANIDGFSSINAGTELTESVLITPATNILDYNIISSKRKEEHHEVKIEAIIGNLEAKTACYNRKKVGLMHYALTSHTSANLPEWVDYYPEILSNEISENLNKSGKVRNIDNKLIKLDTQRLSRNLSFDYKALTETNIIAKSGDFVYSPRIGISKTLIEPKWYREENIDGQIRPELIDTVALKINVKLEVFNAVSYEKAFVIEDDFLIPMAIDSKFEYIKLFTKSNRNSIRKKISEIAFNLALEIENQLLCLPLNANLLMVNGELEVPIGLKHGIKNNQLAVLENTNYNDWVVMKVKKVDFNKAILEPLNSDINKETVVGRLAKFLE